MNLREDWLFRGLVYQSTDPDLLERLSKGGVTAYIGFDPTASSLHLGHLLQMTLLRRLQLAGNRPIALAGGGTGLIGDPSFKDAERPLLTAEEIAYNVGRIAGQLEGLLDFSDVRRRDPGAAAQQRGLADDRSPDHVLARRGQALHGQPDGGQGDRAQPPGTRRRRAVVHRVLVPAAPGVRLLASRLDYGCTLQLGGSDQWGNITVGTELVRKNDPAIRLTG